MIGGLRRRQIVEIVLGLAPVTFFIFPFLVVAVVGMGFAEVARGAMDWALNEQIFWALAAAAGVVALWAIVLNDGARLPWRSRIAITLGLLLGMVSAVRWLSSMMGRHSYGASTWAVWIVLLGGPLVVGSLRLVQLWISPQRNGPRPPASATSAPRSGGPPY